MSLEITLYATRGRQGGNGSWTGICSARNVNISGNSTVEASLPSLSPAIQFPFLISPFAFSLFLSQTFATSPRFATLDRGGGQAVGKGSIDGVNSSCQCSELSRCRCSWSTSNCRAGGPQNLRNEMCFVFL